MTFNISLHIEALIFAAKQPVSLDNISKSLTITFDQTFSNDELTGSLGSIRIKCNREDSIYELVEIDGGYLFFTKGQYHKTLEDYLKLTNKKKLTKTAMETIAIVAYRQPVTKSEIEEIRGVSADYSIRKLLEKELIDIVGRSDGPGRPLQYGCSKKFMDYFGLKSIKDLPKLKEIVPDEEPEASPVMKGISEEE